MSFNHEKFRSFMMANKDLPHTSKYHAETFFQHVMCMVQFVNYTAEYNRALIMATGRDDIGKPSAHVYREGKGNTFYGHEETGATMVKEFLTEDDPDYDQVVFLVREHMLPFQIKGPEPWASYAQKQLIEFASQKPSIWIANLFYLNELDEISNPDAKFEELVEELYNINA